MIYAVRNSVACTVERRKKIPTANRPAREIQKALHHKASFTETACAFL